MSPLSDGCITKLFTSSVSCFCTLIGVVGELKYLISMKSNSSMFPSWLVFFVLCDTSLVTSWSWRFTPGNVTVFFFTFWSAIHLDMIFVCSVRRDTRYVGSLFPLPCSGYAVGSLLYIRWPWGVAQLLGFLFCALSLFSAFALTPHCFSSISFSPSAFSSCRRHCLHPSFSSRIAKWWYLTFLLVLLAGRYV